jgi:hypothetical protein
VVFVGAMGLTRAVGVALMVVLLWELPTVLVGEGMDVAADVEVEAKLDAETEADMEAEGEVSGG